MKEILCLTNTHLDESPLTSVTVTASGNTVIVMWPISSSGDDVTGYLVHNIHHPNHDTTITTINNSNVHLDIFKHSGNYFVFFSLIFFAKSTKI